MAFRPPVAMFCYRYLLARRASHHSGSCLRIQRSFAPTVSLSVFLGLLMKGLLKGEGKVIHSTAFFSFSSNRTSYFFIPCALVCLFLNSFAYISVVFIHICVLLLLRHGIFTDKLLNSLSPSFRPYMVKRFALSCKRLNICFSTDIRPDITKEILQVLLS